MHSRCARWTAVRVVVVVVAAAAGRHPMRVVPDHRGPRPIRQPHPAHRPRPRPPTPPDALHRVQAPPGRISIERCRTTTLVHPSGQPTRIPRPGTHHISEPPIHGRPPDRTISTTSGTAPHRRQIPDRNPRVDWFAPHSPLHHGTSTSRSCQPPQGCPAHQRPVPREAAAALLTGLGGGSERCPYQ